MPSNSYDQSCIHCGGNGKMPLTGDMCDVCFGSGRLDLTNGSTETMASVDQTRQTETGVESPRDQENQALIDKMPNDTEEEEKKKKEALERSKKEYEDHDKQNMKNCPTCLGNGLMPFVGDKCTCCHGSGKI